jgi:hypothetical protein
MCGRRCRGNPVSLKALVRVAEASAAYADHGTGRDSRPTNQRLATDTGLSVRTVQRADTALRLLGVATEVLRGRQRTRAERCASWRVGDRGRGWASVWALHDNPFINRLIRVLSPHPEGSPFRDIFSRKKVLTTRDRRRGGAGNRGARRRASPDGGAVALARHSRSGSRLRYRALRPEVSPRAFSTRLLVCSSAYPRIRVDKLTGRVLRASSRN